MSISTGLCGTFVSGAWAATSYQESCAVTTGYTDCKAYVWQSAGGFKDAYWEIASISVYEHSPISPPPPPPPSPGVPPPDPPKPPYAPIPSAAGTSCNSIEWATTFGTNWVDTDSEDCTMTSDYDGEPHVLVFSDEFETEGYAWSWLGQCWISPRSLIDG